MPEKYQEEIEEILKGLGQQAPEKPSGQTETPADDAPRRAAPAEQTAAAPYQPSRQSFKITPSKIAVAGLIILVLGAFWLQPLIWVGLVLLAAAYLMFFVKPKSLGYTKHWRDRPLEEQPESMWGKFSKWLKN